MNHFRLAIAALLLFITPFWTAAQDLKITRIINASPEEVKAGTNKNLGLRVKMSGTSNSENFSVSYKINGGPTMLSVEAFPMTNIVDGTALIPCPITFPSEFDVAVNIKIFVELEDDINTENDTAKALFMTREKVANDLALTFNSANSDLPGGTTIMREFTLKNVGTNDFPTGTLLLSYQLLNGAYIQSPQSITYDGETLKPGDETILEATFMIDQNLIGDSVNFCQYLYWMETTDTAIITLEGNLNDNALCKKFNIVDPTGVETKNSTDFIQQLYVEGQSLNLIMNTDQKINEPLLLSIYGMNGKLVYTSTITNTSAQYSIPLEHVTRGIYILKMATPTSQSSKKFLIK